MTAPDNGHPGIVVGDEFILGIKTAEDVHDGEKTRRGKEVGQHQGKLIHKIHNVIHGKETGGFQNILELFREFDNDVHTEKKSKRSQ